MAAGAGGWLVTQHQSSPADVTDMSEAERLSVEDIAERTELTLHREAEERRPTAEAECPVSGNDEAYVGTDTPRAPEGAETRTFVCTECDHEWEEFLD